MKNKLIYILLIIYAICISAGVFIEIVTPATDISIFAGSLSSFFAPTNLTKENFFPLIFDYIKDDFFFVLSLFLLSCFVITLPICILLTMAKVFSMGFCAAFILNTARENSISIILSGILPRALFRVPIYFYLTIISIKTAKYIYENRHNLKSLKRLKSFGIEMGFSFMFLAISSLIEVCLLLIVL